MVIRAFLLALLVALPARAETLPVPDQTEAARLVWSTLTALDHANRTGNYSVLRDLSAPGFREANTAADLAMIFAQLRANDPGLARVLLAQPVFTAPPGLAEDGRLYMAGSFPARPVGVGFELLFEPVAGEWRLFGISVTPVGAAGEVEPGAP